MTEVPSGGPGASKGVAFTNWLVNKAAGVLERKSSRRGFLVGSAMVGSAVAVAGCAPGTQPGSPYSHITDCAGGLCTDGYTEFCCTINNGINACPPGTFVAGWWRADYSSFCNGTRYYMDCNQSCCGPDLGNGFCAGCVECTCGGGCDTRRIYCNYFRYGQCHQEVGILGPIACRLVTCTPPYTVAEYACTSALAVDNATAEHAPAHGCTPPPPPLPPFVSASVLPPLGAATADGFGRISVFGRRTAGNITWAQFDGANWGGTVDLGGSFSSGVAAVDNQYGQWLFARGSGNNHIWWQQYSSGWASGWGSLGGNVVSDPAAAASGTGLYVFVRGSDDGLWMSRSFGGGGFSGFVPLGGAITSDPVAAGDDSGVYVFARGNNDTVYYQHVQGDSWSGWNSLGSLTATSDCWAVSDPAGLFVFVRGANNAPYWGRFVNGAWSGWSSLGGTITSDPNAVSASEGVFVFARGDDGSIYANRFNGSWSGWSSLGGVATSTPVAASDPTSGTFVFVRGNDGGLYYQRRVNNAWLGGWQGLGGDFAPVRGGR